MAIFTMLKSSWKFFLHRSFFSIILYYKKHFYQKEIFLSISSSYFVIFEQLDYRLYDEESWRRANGKVSRRSIKMIAWKASCIYLPLLPVYIPFVSEKFIVKVDKVLSKWDMIMIALALNRISARKCDCICNSKIIILMRYHKNKGKFHIHDNKRREIKMLF